MLSNTCLICLSIDSTDVMAVFVAVTINCIIYLNVGAYFVRDAGRTGEREYGEVQEAAARDGGSRRESRHGWEYIGPAESQKPLSLRSTGDNIDVRSHGSYIIFWVLFLVAVKRYNRACPIVVTEAIHLSVRIWNQKVVTTLTASWIEILRKLQEIGYCGSIGFLHR